MAFDGIVTGAVVKELNSLIVGLRIDKIYQVENDEILLYFKKNKLVISASGNNPRIYLTTEKKENPTTAPIFCMVLRKHLNGALVKDIKQYGNDRVLEIVFDAWDDFSEKIEKSLLIEIMGRHSNIILLDNNKIIIDAIKRVNSSMSRVREVLPHLKYQYIKDENKLDPLIASPEEIKSKLLASEKNKSIENLLFSMFTGFSKNIGTELCVRAGVEATKSLNSLDANEINRLISTTQDFSNEIKKKNYEYNLYLENEKIIDFHVLKLKNMEGINKETFESASKLLDAVYSKRDKDDRMGQKSQAMKKTISNKLAKDQSKLINLQKDLLEAENREIFRIYADVLSANFHKVKPGQKEISLQNFYSENLEEILVPLDEKLSAPLNAQKYYKKYGKLKNAELVLNRQIEETESEIKYLESVLSEIDLAENIEDLDTTKDELIEEGYIKRNQRKKKKKESAFSIFEYDFEGFKIYVGKNNRANDMLTHKIARRDDLWFHVQGLPGSHVIIKTDGKAVSENVVNFAAQLAAYNSKARNSGSVEVDYTKKGNVKRHPANKPGLVNYVDFNTILVSSNEPRK